MFMRLTAQGDQSVISILFFYSGIWPPYLADYLSPRLIEAVGARNYVRSPCGLKPYGYLNNLCTCIFINTCVSMPASVSIDLCLPDLRDRAILVVK